MHIHKVFVSHFKKTYLEYFWHFPLQFLTEACTQSIQSKQDCMLLLLKFYLNLPDLNDKYHVLLGIFSKSFRIIFNLLTARRKRLSSGRKKKTLVIRCHPLTHKGTFILAGCPSTEVGRGVFFEQTWTVWTLRSKWIGFLSDLSGWTLINFLLCGIDNSHLSAQGCTRVGRHNYSVKLNACLC